MRSTLNKMGAIALLGVTSVALVGCGSSSDDPIASPDSSPSTTVTVAPTTTTVDDPAADQLVDGINDPQVSDVYLALDRALADYDTLAAQLPPDVRASYDQLKADVAHAEPLTGDQAVVAYTQVKSDIDQIDAQLESADASSIEPIVVDAWGHVKTEFDRIDAGF